MPLLSEVELADELVEDQVGEVEEGPHHDAGDDDDDGALDQVVLRRPLDLAELTDRLADEVADPRSLPPARGAGRCGLERGAGRRRSVDAGAPGHRALARLAPGAPFRSRLASH